MVFGKSLFDRGLTFGSSGNLSARLKDGFLVTPTNCCLGTLEPSQISKLDLNGNLIAGDAPTKEKELHLAIYQENAQAGAVVHLHSTYCTALSCLRFENAKDILPPVTPYFTMKLGRLAMVPYFAPGDEQLVEVVRAVAHTHKAILLANHGPIVSNENVEKAVYGMEEFEESAKLYFILKNQNVHYLSEDQITQLINRES